MPTLADIYSALNTFKRKSSDFVQNPGTSLEQMLFAANENAREFNKKHALATDYTIAQARGQQPTPEQTQAEMGLRNTLSEAYSPGMTVWHGSPHVFERFDLRKIGTGEGAQSYGSGMYVAQNPKVAEDYAKNIMGPKATPANVALKTFNATGSEDMVATRLKQIFPQINDAEIKSSIDTAKNYKGNVYKVDVPDTHIRRMLDWDAPLKDQPTPVRKLAKALGLDMNDLGGDLLAKVGKDEAGRKTLQDAGIRGIKYLDQNSRHPGTASLTPHQIDTRINVLRKDIDSGLGDQNRMKQILSSLEAEKALHTNLTRNFVVFDPSHMTILERNQQAIK
jgi:hypothetical protein